MQGGSPLSSPPKRHPGCLLFELMLFRFLQAYEQSLYSINTWFLDRAEALISKKPAFIKYLIIIVIIYPIIYLSTIISRGRGPALQKTSTESDLEKYGFVHSIQCSFIKCILSCCFLCKEMERRENLTSISMSLRIGRNNFMRLHGTFLQYSIPSSHKGMVLPPG